MTTNLIEPCKIPKESTNRTDAKKLFHSFQTGEQITKYYG